jgi:hypothetical protein
MEGSLHSNIISCAPPVFFVCHPTSLASRNGGALQGAVRLRTNTWNAWGQLHNEEPSQRNNGLYLQCPKVSDENRSAARGNRGPDPVYLRRQRTGEHQKPSGATSSPTRMTISTGSGERLSLTPPMTYDKLDKASFRDRLGRVTQYVHHANWHLIRVTDPLNRATLGCMCGNCQADPR